MGELPKSPEREYLESLISRLRQYYVSHEDCRKAALLIEELILEKDEPNETV